MPGIETVASLEKVKLQVQFTPGRVGLRIENYDPCHVEVFPLDRSDINNLIKKLREARDYSYGEDQ